MTANSKEETCIFCQIANGECSKTEILFQNESIVIFKDIKPASEHHYLAVPKTHIQDARYLEPSDKPLVLEMQNALRELLDQKSVPLSDVSYGFHWPPFVSVRHLHMHAIAPASKMSFIARQIFKPINMWYCTPEYVCQSLDSKAK